MDFVKEEAFPRGGRKLALYKSKRKLGSSLFNKPKVKTKKSLKKNKQSEDPQAVKSPKVKQIKDPLGTRIVEDLRATILQDGMLILGIVSNISEKIVNVSLPGFLRGAINLANVSEHYTKAIENVQQNSEVPSLSDIFQVGDVLPVKLLSVSENHNSLLVTSDPKLINQKLSYDLIENGFILTGSVKSKEDHGFIIDFGIDHVNAFLHFNKVEPNKNLITGQLVRCCIMSCNKSPGSCNVQLSTLKIDLKSSVIKNKSKLPLFCFVPGFQFEVTMEKKLIEGVEVRYGTENSLKGYIHEGHVIKKFSDLSEIEIGSKSIATLLYIKPLINLPYFKMMPKKQIVWPFQYGEIVQGKVMKAKGFGVFFKIIEGSRKAKCFVPISKLQNGNKWLEDRSAFLNLYPVNKIVKKVRLRHMDYMSRCYFGATDRVSIDEKYYSVSDVKCGDIISCKILSFDKTSACLQLGKTVNGFVPFNDMTDVPLANPASKFKVGQVVKARVTEVIPTKHSIRLTMKPALLKEKEILCDLEDFKKDTCYVGSVLKVLDSKLIVKFFNRIKGVVTKYQTPFADSSSLRENFYEGQLVKCFVVSFEKGKLSLTLLSNKSDASIEIGKKYKAKVTNVISGGFFLDVELGKDKKVKGYLPKELLTAHISLSAAFLSTYSSGDKLSVYCLSKSKKQELPVFGAAEVFNEFYEGKSEKELQDKLAVNAVLPFLFISKNRKTNAIFLQNMVPGRSEWRIRVIKDDLSRSNPLSKYQLIYGKVLSIVEEKINLSLKLLDVWDKDFKSSLDFLNSYLKAVDALVKKQKDKLQVYNGDVYLGCPVKGVIEEVRKSHAVVRTNSNDLGLLEGKFTQGDEVNGKIVWIDAPDQMIYIKASSKCKENDKKKKGNFVPENDHLRGRVAFINDELAVIELKGRGNGELAFLPRRRHANDFENTKCLFAVGDEMKVWITKKDYLLAMDRQVVNLQEKIIWRKANNELRDSVRPLKGNVESNLKERNKKRKVDPAAEDIEVVDVKLARTLTGDATELIEIKEEVDDDDVFNVVSNGVPRLEYDDLDIKSEADDLEKTQSSCTVKNDERIILSSSSESEDEKESHTHLDNSKAFNVGFNWDVLNNQSLLFGATLNKEDSSDDNDDDDDLNSDKKRKRRLTASEKREKAKSEEERLRFIEERLMDPTRDPETADDFDRAVLSNPDSSALWLKYMAFHIQGTEIEKARAVARRALKAISFRQEQEKLNIWIALLNLENLYGNDDSLNKTLSEALQYNDPYKVHLHMLNINGQSNKLQEMEKLGNFILKKYKDVESMWYDLAHAYFSVGKVESARNVLQKALTVIDKKQHIRLISKFAQLENKYGSPERAQTLYESILASFPKSIDIWSCYVDMLVKSNHIDLARQVLERATSQNLRPRKMKTLFKKFITFEETHGTPENVEKVREAAVEYVNTVGAIES